MGAEWVAERVAAEKAEVVKVAGAEVVMEVEERVAVKVAAKAEAAMEEAVTEEEARVAVVRVAATAEGRSAVHSRCNQCQRRTVPACHTRP